MKSKKKHLKDLKDVMDDKEFAEYLLREGGSDREKLLGNVMTAMSSENLAKMNDFLDFKIPNPDKELVKNLTTVGLFREEGDKLYFVDWPEIAQYFPGYARNKEYWETRRNIGHKTNYMEGFEGRH